MAHVALDGRILLSHWNSGTDWRETWEPCRGWRTNLPVTLVVSQGNLYLAHVAMTPHENRILFSYSATGAQADWSPASFNTSEEWKTKYAVSLQ